MKPSNIYNSDYADEMDSETASIDETNTQQINELQNKKFLIINELQNTANKQPRQASSTFSSLSSSIQK